MDMIIKCAAVAMVGAILSLVTKKQVPALGTLVSLAVVLILCSTVMGFLKPVMGFADSLRSFAGLEHTLLLPVIKALGIGFLTEMGKNICTDAGESAIAGVLGMAGGVAGVYVMLPLMEGVLELMERLL